MISRINLVAFLLFVCSSCLNKEQSSIALNANHKFNSLIEVEELAQLDSNQGYAIVDFRPKEAYVKGHLPNAVQIWYSDIENKDYPYSGMIPTKQQVEKLFSEKGLKNSDTLIIYDDRGSISSARLWWILDYYGFQQTRILNGGLHAYRAAGHKLSLELPKKDTSSFVLHPSAPRHHISKEELLIKVKNDRSLVLIDTRTKDEFSGKRQKRGATRAGNIPGSHSLEWLNAVDSSSQKKFLPLSELEKLYSNIIPDKESEVVVYCHSGARSSHTTFVLTQLLGYKNVHNYDGSWTEWSYFKNLPIKKEVETVTFE